MVSVTESDLWLALIEDVTGEKDQKDPSSTFFYQEESIDEELDDYFHQGENKEHLMLAQIQFLERNSEVENKLELERKYQLAKDICLEPQQVASLWFQNRRPQLKTSHLEKDYEALQASYSSLKANYNRILEEKEKLNEVLYITENMLSTQSQPPPEKSIASSVEISKVSIVASSDVVLDLDSLCYPDGFCCSHLEPGDFSYVFQQADLSHNKEENFSRSLESPPP